MKNLKKIASVLTTVALVASMGTSVFATGLTSTQLADSEKLDTTAGTYDSVKYYEVSSTNGQGGDASTVVTIQADATNFKVTVPIALHVKMAADGTMTYADSMESGKQGAAKIINECDLGMVEITDVEVKEANSWKIAAYTDDFANKKVNTKEYGFKVNGLPVKTDGSLDGFVAETTETIGTVKTASEKTDANAVFADYTITRSNSNTKAFPVIKNGSVLPIYYEAKLPATSSAIAETVVGGIVFTVDFN